MIKDGTYQLINGELIAIERDSGYWVSLQGFETKVNKRAINDFLVNELVSAYNLLALRESANIGVWSTNDYVYFDLSEHVIEKDKAIELGVGRNQDAIWDIESKAPISLSGILPQSFFFEAPLGAGKVIGQSSLSGDHAREQAEGTLLRKQNSFEKD